jgi:hypothetical protein
MDAASRATRAAERAAEDARVIEYARARRAALTDEQRSAEDEERARLRSILGGVA